MAKYYFAQDGSWGDATDLVFVDEDLTEDFTDEMWEDITNASDYDRLALVERLLEQIEEQD
jgi:hypothetical protein